MELTPPLLQAFFTQLDMRYQQGYQRRKTYWQDFAELAPSSTESNTYAWLAELPGLRKWIGPKLARNIAARAYALVNVDFENTFTVDRNKIEDDTAGIYGRSAELQGDAAARWPDDLITDALIAGTTTLGYDGQFFFDVDHPVDLDDSSQGVYSNFFTTTPLTQANFNAVYASMMKFKGESGKPLGITPTVLMVGPDQRQIATEICKAQNITQIVKNVAGAENVAAAGSTNINMGDVMPIVNPRLAADTTGAWYLASTDRVRPMIFQQRKAPTRIGIIDPQNPLVFNQRQYAYSVEARGAAGYGLPFLICKAQP
jgi:phage major head subunit gpT-like protein